METSIDPRMYSGETLPADIKAPEVTPAVPVSSAPVPEVPVGAVMRGTVLDAQANAGQLQQQFKVEAPIMASVGAAMTQTSIADAWQFMTKPAFEPDIGTAWKAPFLSNVPFTMSTEEREFIQKQTSLKGAQWAVERIQSQKEAQTAMQDHPFAAGLTAMADPGYFGIDIATLGAAKALRVGRLGAGMAATAGAGAVAGVQAQVRPMSTQDILQNALLNGAVTSMLWTKGAKPGEGKLVQKDPDFPGAELQEIAQAGIKIEPARAPRMVGDKVMLEDAGLGGGGAGKSADTLTFDMPGMGVKPKNPRPFPKDLEPGVTHERAAVAVAVEKTLAQKTGETIAWNTHKTMSSYGAVGREIADLILDNHGNYGIHSIESEQRAVKSGMTRLKWVHDDLLRDAMAEDGFGLKNQIVKYTEATAHQSKLESEVFVELLRREQNHNQGRPLMDSQNPVNPRAAKLADAHAKIPELGLKEMKAAGVKGTETLEGNPGYAKRKWDSGKITAKMNELTTAGMTPKQAKKAIHQLVGNSVARATGMADDIAQHVGQAIIDRSLRAGAFEDAIFNANMGSDTAKVVRDMLNASGIKPKEVQRVMDVLTAQTNEAGKAGFLKHRVDLDYTSSLEHNGVSFNITDLLDHNLSGLTDRYIDNVSSQVAFARKGYTDAESLTKLRERLVADTAANPLKQKEAVELFDNLIKHTQGLPAGGAMNQTLRTVGVVNRMISLGASGYWQLTEYATMMAHFGALKTIKYMVQEMPMFKGMLETAATNKQYSQHLKDILTNAADENLRLKPFLQRFEDGFDMPQSASVQMALQHASQLVPYLNGMKYVHAHQARVTANLIIDTINNAAKGDAKAAKALEKYGVTAEHLTSMKADVTAHGMQVDKWADGTWSKVRPAFMKMMDESVLHQRMGDMPAFALLDPVGKFVFTYRGFVLQAHNKVLAGGLQRDGFAGVGLMMLYQFPMAAAAVQAQSTLNGKGALDAKELAKRAIGQMGGVGLGSEIWGWASGTKKSVGAPGLIPLDRVAALVGDTFKGDKPAINTAIAGSGIHVRYNWENSASLELDANPALAAKVADVVRAHKAPL